MSLSKLITWLIPLSIVTGVCIFIVFFILSLGGNIDGREFSPDNFSIRYFKYNKVPYLNWVISSKETSDQTGDIQQDLFDLGLLPVNSPPKTWHLVSETDLADSLQPPECDARFLVYYLELKSLSGSSVLIDWNEKHPDLAFIFWPHVIEMARQELYLKIPEIMEFALTDYPRDPVKFSDELKTLVAQAYLDLGEIDYHLGKLKRAKTRLQLSLDIQPSKKAQTLLNNVLDSNTKELVQ